jgi:DNA-binding NarL/FixJ family response regulator
MENDQMGNRIPNPIRVLLADDHQVVRVGIRKILNRADDLVVVGEATNGMEAVALTLELQPDVLLLDIEMPGLSGLGVAKHLKESGCQTQILVLSGYDDREYIQALLHEDIAGYLIKGETPGRIVTAIRSIAGGHGGVFSDQVRVFVPGYKENPASI